MVFGIGFSFGAPASVTDLAVSGSGFRHASLSWSTPYDVASSTTPCNYEIRLSTYAPITSDAIWNAYSTINSYPYDVVFSTANISAGQPASITVTGLTDGICHFFAIRSSTDGINWSLLDTPDQQPFATPSNTAPGQVSGHNLFDAMIVYTSTPTLSWSVPSAGSTDSLYGDSITSYTIEVSTSLSFAVVDIKNNNPTTSWITDPLNNDTTYYWRVKAYDSEGLCSTSFLSPQTYRFIAEPTDLPPTAPTLNSPINSTILNNQAPPTLIWSQCADPDPGDSVQYSVYYSTRSDFAVNVTTQTNGVAITQYTPSDIIENAKYFWKVYAVDSRNMQTMSTSTGTFWYNQTAESPDPFTLVSPINNVMIFTSTPTLSWNAATEPDPGAAVTYTVLYSSSDPTLLSVFTSSSNLTINSFITPALADHATYFWQAQAVASTFQGPMTTLSSITSFYTHAIDYAPAAFDLISSSGIVRYNPTPQFKWQTSSQQDNEQLDYTIYISTYSDFSFYISSAGFLATQYAPTFSLNDNTTYYWKVKAKTIYNTSTYSTSVFTISADVSPDSPTAFDLLSPAI